MTLPLNKRIVWELSLIHISFGVALGVKLDLAEGGFHHVRAEGFHDLLGVGAAGGLDGFKQGDLSLIHILRES